MGPIWLRWPGIDDDDEGLREPPFVDESLQRLAFEERCEPPDTVEVFEELDDKSLLILISVDPFRPSVRYRVHLVLQCEAGEMYLDVCRVERM